MKFTTSVLSSLALCVANVAAQDFGSLPPCAQGCAANAIPASCSLVDVHCICSASSFITSVSCCVATACDAADQQTTIQFAQQLCAGAGITNLPSAAACSATGAATSAAGGTSTADAGSSATSKASAASSAVTSAKPSSAVSSTATTTTATGTASSSASSTSHSGAATPLAKGNGVAAAGAGAAALLAAIFV